MLLMCCNIIVVFKWLVVDADITALAVICNYSVESMSDSSNSAHNADDDDCEGTLYIMLYIGAIVACLCLLEFGSLQNLPKFWFMVRITSNNC